MKPLLELALRLKKGAPQQFNEFLNGLLTDHQRMVADLTGAPPETVLVHQGRVQQSAKLLRILTECDLPPASQ